VARVAAVHARVRRQRLDGVHKAALALVSTYDVIVHAEYLQAMRRADNDEFGPLGELIARSVTTNLYRFVKPAVAGPVKLVPYPLRSRGAT
jgi:hypothetical protein